MCIAFIITIPVNQAMAIAAHSLCAPAGYTIGFFNGVWNTYPEALGGLIAVIQAVPKNYKDKTVAAELFYNHSGCGGDSQTCLQDLAETFIQRAQELDATGTLSARLEYFWESLGSDSTSFSDKIKNLFDGATSIFSLLYTKIIAQTIAGWSYLLSNPPTADDYARHDTRLDALAAEGQMLLLVAHSQGNLFVNHAYDHILSTLSENGVNVVHIAPASPTLRGPYILADIDLVINALRIQGLSAVPANNLILPISKNDPSGHKLIETYLDGSRAGFSTVTNLMTAGLDALAQSVNDGEAAGSFTVTLNWSGSGDEDLHIFEPSGSHVYYGNKQGTIGFLDTDNTYGYGPEHYYASCDPSVLQPGTYHIGINNYRFADYQTATIQVATPNSGVIMTKQLNTGTTIGRDGDNSPLSALDIVVTKDSKTGEFTISAQ